MLWRILLQQLIRASCEWHANTLQSFPLKKHMSKRKTPTSTSWPKMLSSSDISTTVIEQRLLWKHISWVCCWTNILPFDSKCNILRRERLMLFFFFFFGAAFLTLRARARGQTSNYWCPHTYMTWGNAMYGKLLYVIYTCNPKATRTSVHNNPGNRAVMTQSYSKFKDMELCQESEVGHPLPH